MSTAAKVVRAPVVEDRAVGLWADALRRMRRNPSAIIGGLIVAFFLLMAIFAPFIAPYDPTQGNLAESYLPPSSDHWFGTNVQGQDMFSRIVFGSRLTLGIATLSVIIGVSVGATFGAIAGYFRGRVDSVIMRAVDIMLSSFAASVRNASSSAGVMDFPRIGASFEGSMNSPFLFTPKCRCGPVDKPVVPT